MSNYRFAEVPSNDSVASLVTLLVCAWFLAASGAMLTESSVESQSRALHAKTPVVTVRQLSVTEAVHPDARLTIHVVAQRVAKVS